MVDKTIQPRIGAKLLSRNIVLNSKKVKALWYTKDFQKIVIDLEEVGDQNQQTFNVSPHQLVFDQGTNVSTAANTKLYLLMKAQKIHLVGKWGEFSTTLSTSRRI